ncbi:DUF3575 domain-containing protein [Sediminitomix flava]|uniref:Uncharacterized protein DUF3575 n=1 Tax=Sediminitomix flava TaxID=379075 RepID=A0A315Z6T2_SEDFL|nr:DUF3575 domain-containing protein [Sediminitomix flava]PWJ38465.1 uncharacterized protein DUF3575 [Sediminitomix flava]
MKKALLLFFALLLTTSIVNAQDEQPKNLVKVNPLGALLSVYNLTYERQIGETASSVLLSGEYLNWSTLGITGTSVGIEYRFHFSKNRTSPAGMYLSPVLSVGSLTETSSDNSVAFTRIGAVFGHQWIYDSGFVLDLYGGYGSYSFDESSFDEGTSISATGPILGIALGYAF